MLSIRSVAVLAAFVVALPVGVATAHGPSSAPQTALQTAPEPVDAAPAEALNGTVHEIIVDDATRGTSQRFVELLLADGSLVALQGDAAQRLTRGARVEVTGRRHGNPLAVESVRAVQAVPSNEIKAVAEIDGTLAVLHADYFDDGRSSFIFEVHRASGAVHRLRMASTPAVLQPGTSVRVRGRVDADGESMTPEQITVVARPQSSDGTSTGIVKAATSNRVLVIMANFNNTAAPAFSAAQVQQVMTSNADSVANFFRETSFGQQVMNVTVTPAWITANMPQPQSCGSADWRAIGTNADAAARALGAAYDPATYNFVVYVFPAVPSCGWLGLAYINNPHKAWINGVGAFRTSTIAHEMGHNFGLLHAASLRCSGATIGGSCSSSEYGDPFGAMGNQRPMHFNAMQKSKLAWIPSTSVKTHAGGSATYTLSPLEVAGGATYAVRIPTGSSSRTYWLEFRQPIGFDSPLASFANNGAQVRVASPFETQCPGCDSYSDDTQLLDMTPSTSSFTDATLVAGRTFTDPTYGFSVTVMSATAGALTVQIGTGGAPPPPVPAATTTAIAATPNPSAAGTPVTFTAVVTGSAPTGTVRFTDGGVAMTGCSAVALSGSGNARTATCASSSLAAGTHTIVAAYSGNSANDASSGMLTQTVQSAAVPAAVPVYRFNAGAYHVYTNSAAEKDYVLANLPQWRLEGIAFYADTGSSAQTRPVYRFSTGSMRFYTQSESEKNYIVANLPGFVLEGVAFYASPVKTAQTLPVYRFNTGVEHFYTISEAEKNYIVANIPSYRLEGVAFYARSSP
jgi:hypothetical protein